MKPESLNKWAVIVGSKGYQAEPIAGDNSARAMASALRSVYSFDNKKVRLLINNKYTWDALTEALAWLRQNTDEQSSVFFFYSGHGYISPTFLNQEFETIKYAKLAVVQEGCFSGNICAPMAYPNRVIIGSTLPNEYGYSLPSKSGFMCLFIEQGIKRGKADINGDGQVSMQEAFAYYQEKTYGDGTISDNYPGELVP